MNEAGLAECIVRAINACEPNIHALLYGRYELQYKKIISHVLCFKEYLDFLSL